MTKSPRLTNQPSRTTEDESQPKSAMILLWTALDTTWRAFIPTIGGTFLGVGLDNLFNIKPWATIICMIIGFALSTLLITKQLYSIRKPRK